MGGGSVIEGFAADGPARLLRRGASVCIRNALRQKPHLDSKIMSWLRKRTENAEGLRQDINDSGQVVGFLRNPDYSTIGVTYDIATHTLESIRGASAANGVNNGGLIVGTTASGAFYMDGTFHDLGKYYSAHGLNELGQIAGSKSNDNPYRLVPRPTNPAIYDVSAQLWRELEIATVYARGTLPGVYADLYTLMDINDSGYAVGNYRKYGLTTAYGFLVTPGFDTVLTPIAGSNSTANAINGQGLIVAFDGTGSYDADGSITAYHWDFGDGTASGSAKVSHLYVLAGAYTATLTVTDDDGVTDQASIVISVNPPADRRFRHPRWPR